MISNNLYEKCVRKCVRKITEMKPNEILYPNVDSEEFLRKSLEVVMFHYDFHRHPLICTNQSLF